MSRPKTQNSILVLATLGVYLGLVLVGATPQVLAQAAMTKQFNVKDEVEVKDDLDKKPDDCDTFETKAIEKAQRFRIDQNAWPSYARIIASISSVARKIHPGDILLNSTVDGDGGSSRYTTVSFGGKPVLYPFSTRNKLEKEITDLFDLFRPTNASGLPKLEFSLSFNDSGSVAITKVYHKDTASAHIAYVAYDSAIDFWRCSAQSTGEKSIAKQTDISWSNDQVILVTHLPRAGLDSLFASDAK